jgi:hypothetical protein
MTVEKRDQCYFCKNSVKEISLTESNRHFLLERVKEQNIDEAITVSRIAWDNFPTLKESIGGVLISASLLQTRHILLLAKKLYARS